MLKCFAISLLFLLSSSILYGQEDYSPADTVPVVTDSAYSITVPPPDEASVDEEGEEYEEEYFQPKSIWPPNEELKLRQVPDSILKVYANDDDFWYSNLELKKKKTEPRTRKGISRLSQTILWIIIIGGFLAFIIIYLSGSNIGLFRRKRSVIATSADEEELITEDIFAINYQKEIEKAERAGNYRLAIRLHFLRLLKEMADRSIIQYKQDKTNMDYLLQLFNTSYYKEFFHLTRNYEYSWYGQFEVGEKAYDVIRKDFQIFEKRFS